MTSKNFTKGCLSRDTGLEFSGDLAGVCLGMGTKVDNYWNSSDWLNIERSRMEHYASGIGAKSHWDVPAALLSKILDTRSIELLTDNQSLVLFTILSPSPKGFCLGCQLY